MNLALSESLSRCIGGGYSQSSFNSFVQSDKSCPFDTVYKTFLALEASASIVQEPKSAAILALIGGVVKSIRNVYCHNQQVPLAIIGESFAGLMAAAMRTTYFVNSLVEGSNKWSPLAGILIATLSYNEETAQQQSIEKGYWLKVIDTAQNGNLTAIDEQIRKLNFLSFQAEGECNPLFYLIDQVKPEVQNNIMNAMMSKSINLNPVDVNGETPLHLAILNEKASFVEKLISHPKIGLEAVNANGLTPLRLAFNRKLYTIVEMLVKKGANVNFISRSRQHMAHECYEQNDLAMFNILAAGNLNEKALNLDGKTIKERALEDARLEWLASFDTPQPTTDDLK